MRYLVLIGLFFAACSVFGQEETVNKVDSSGYEIIMTDEVSSSCDDWSHGPQYPGGRKAMLDFFNANLRVPPAGMCASGFASPPKCFLRFTVEATGEITHITVMRGIPDCAACDDEIIRVLMLMPLWEPETTGQKTIRSTVNLPVTFGIL